MGTNVLHIFANLFTTQERAGLPPTQNPSLFDNHVKAKESGCLNTPITEEKIMLSISSMKAKSAPCVDGICSKIFKCTANIVSKYMYLVCLFNEVFECGEFPDSWSENIISPTHKKGSVYGPNNYRAIANLNSISKIFINLLSKRLNTWCDHNDILDVSQAGFRKGYSTVIIKNIDNLFNLQSVQYTPSGFPTFRKTPRKIEALRVNPRRTLFWSFKKIPRSSSELIKFLGGKLEQ